MTKTDFLAFPSNAGDIKDVTEHTVAEFADLVGAMQSELNAHPSDYSDCAFGHDDDDSGPWLELTVAMFDTGDAWRHQTGDNSFQGACYGVPHWAVVTVTADSDATSIAQDIADQIRDLRHWS